MNQKTVTVVRGLLISTLAIGGLVLLGVGLWQIHPPTSQIVMGGLMLAGAVYGGRR